MTRQPQGPSENQNRPDPVAPDRGLTFSNPF
jgi:hypothetical protein